VQIRRKKKRDDDVGISLCSRERRRKEEEVTTVISVVSACVPSTTAAAGGCWVDRSLSFLASLCLSTQLPEHNSVVMSRIQIDPAADRRLFGGAAYSNQRVSADRPTDQPSTMGCCCCSSQCLFCLSVCSHLFSLMCLYYSSCAQAAADSGSSGSHRLPSTQTR